ncbi:MAG: hypothetical protein ABSA75_14140 [Candidatus Bathyarchaeia archaeon]|jgi:hypothetical protein
MTESDESAGTRSTQPLCPTCNQPLTWVPQYKKWYCYNDQKYVDQTQFTKKENWKEGNKRLMIFGIILLAIGLFASFYFAKGLNTAGYSTTVYPYQNIGILLDGAGIICIVLWLLYPPQKIIPAP